MSNHSSFCTAERIKRSSCTGAVEQQMHIQYSTPLCNGSIFNDLYVQTRSSPGMNLIHVAPSLLDHFDVKLPVCVALFTCPFTSVLVLSQPSPRHSPPHISVCVCCQVHPHGDQSGTSDQCSQTYLGRKSGNEEGREREEARQRKRRDQIQNTLKTWQQKIHLSGRASPTLQL